MGTKQQQFADHIIHRISNGEFAIGSYLPSERAVAQEYGLSRVTVRNALKGLVEKKILRSVSGKGYIVNPVSQVAASGTLHIGGLCCSGVYAEHIYSLFHEANNHFSPRGYTLTLTDMVWDDAQQAAAISQMLEKNMNGLLVMPVYSRSSQEQQLGNHNLLLRLRKSGLPLVLLERDIPEEDLPCVVNDEYAGGQMAAQHLIALGHRKIMLLITDYDYYITSRRYKGFRDCCFEHGVQCSVFHIPFNQQHSSMLLLDSYFKCKETLHRILRNAKITAIMVNLPKISLEVMKDLEDLDLEFLFYDILPNVALQRKVWYVERPIPEIARQAVQMLLDEIKGEAKGPVRQIRLKPEIKSIGQI